MAKDYKAKNIQVLTGLEPVQKRPGMYTDTTSPDHLAREVVDNSVDEALAGKADKITVTLYEDGSLAVADNGRGMPVDKHKKHGKSGVELIMTTLHAGAKFEEGSYEYSGGLHGVGVSVVNALSDRLEVGVRRDGHEWTMAFEAGRPAGRLKKARRLRRGEGTGTEVRFWPCAKYFQKKAFSPEELRDLLFAKAVLCPGLTMAFCWEQGGEMKSQDWHYEDGLSEYITQSLPPEGSVLPAPLVFHFADKKQGKVDWAAQFVTSREQMEDMLPESYVNLVPTAQGGTHVAAFRAALLEAVREYCAHRKLLPRGLKLVPEDVMANCVYVLSVRMKDPQFTGQTKGRLASPQAARLVTEAVREFTLWLRRHTEQGDTLAKLVLERAERRRQKKTTLRRSLARGPALPGKLADCSSRDIESTELFLVEGDSAGGSARQARDRRFQAILPLRGKILNTWEVSAGDAIKSNEIKDIATALGVVPGADGTSGLRYGRVCILADADSDGCHIATLLCALFFKHFPALVGEGRLYVAMPPLFRVDAGAETRYALDEEERDKILAELKRGKAKVSVQRFKGLGEMNPSQLRETTMLPGQRRLVRMELSQGGAAEKKMLDLLLSRAQAAQRRAWLEKHGNEAEIAAKVRMAAAPAA